jgi:NADH-quinone oxidoreductase subunit E
VSKPAIEAVAEMLGMPTIRVLEVATFYTMFHLEPVGRQAHIQVCGTTPCMLAGSDEIIAICRSRIHEHPHHVSEDGAFSWEEVECLGACVNAPMVQVGKDTFEDLTRESFGALIDAFGRGERPRPGPQNGRQYSMPITGLTSLTEIAYADEDLAEPDNRDFRPSGASERVVPDHGAANVALDEPRPAVSELSGGEQTESEQLRRKGRIPPGTDGADRVSPEVANQNIGRVDASGRSDEAASAAMGARTVEGDDQLPREHPAAGQERHPDGCAPDAPGPRSDRDSAMGNREG